MSKINEKELHELFCKLKENDKDAYECLYQGFSSLVYRIAFSILKDNENAEDVMQNVFIKLGNLSKEKLPSKYEASWLYSVTKNEAISYLRKNKITLPLEEISEKVKDDELEDFMQKDSYEKIISFLENEDKQIVSLKVGTGMSFKEISSLLNIPMGTVQWKYYKSLHSLKLLIGNLSLFIITATLCVTKLLTNDRKSTNIEEKLENEEVYKNENNGFNDEKKEQASLLNKEHIKEETVIIEDSTEKNNQIIQETIAEENYKMNFTQIGLISLTSVFLCLTILFTIIYANSKMKKKR